MREEWLEVSVTFDERRLHRQRARTAVARGGAQLGGLRRRLEI